MCIGYGIVIIMDNVLLVGGNFVVICCLMFIWGYDLNKVNFIFIL